MRSGILSEGELSYSDRAISKGAWLTLLIIITDQASKYLAEQLLVLHQPVAIIPFFNFTLAYNTGAAFSFLHQAGGWQNLFFIAIALVMSIVLLVMLYRTPRKELQFSLALWLVLGGAIGNVIDRLRISKVVDFIDFYIGEWHFATFNIADIAISIGAFLLIMDSLNIRFLRYRSTQ